MTVQETERTIGAYLDSLRSGGDFAAFFDEDVLWTTMETGDEIRGREAVRDYIIAMHTQVFHASPEPRSAAFADGVAALEAVFAGTHTGAFGPVQPTGATIRVPYAVFYDVSGDKITALRAYFPMLAVAQQLQAAAEAAAQ